MPVKLTHKKSKKSKTNQEHVSLICAMRHVSESDIAKVFPKYQQSWEQDKPRWFKNTLWEFGIDPLLPFIRYDAIPHKNLDGNVVICSRWYGHERGDSEWLASKYASREAKDRAKNSKLVDESYRQRNMTHDVQEAMEYRDDREVYYKQLGLLYDVKEYDTNDGIR